MNKNIFKMLEQLGYTIDHEKFIIKDKEGNELIKKKVCDDVHDGIDFVGKNGELFCFDEGGHVELRLDKETMIIIRNLFNEYNYDSISIYLGPSSADLTICFDVSKRNEIGKNNSIFVSAYEGTIFAEEDDYFNKELGIIEDQNGADIYYFNKLLKHINLDMCTSDNYLDIINRFIGSIKNEDIRNDVEKYFDIILPVFVPLIEDLVNSRELNSGISKKKQ